MQSLRPRAALAHTKEEKLVRSRRNLEAAQYEQAVSAAKAILKQSPDHIEAREVLAKAYWRMGKCSLAIESLELLLRENPYEPGYHYLKGLALQGIGRLLEAESAFATCIKIGDTVEAKNAKEALEALAEWRAVLGPLVDASTNAPQDVAARHESFLRKPRLDAATNRPS